MKILYLATQVKLDSHEASRRHALGIATQLSRINDVTVVLAVNGSGSSEITEDRLTIYTSKFASLIENVGLIRKIKRALVNNFTSIYKLKKLSSEKPDIIYERHSIASWAGIGLSIIMKRTLVFEVNGIPDEEIIIDLRIKNKLVMKLLHLFTKAHLRFAKAIIVQSEELSKIIKARYACKNVFIVPNGADPAKYRSQNSDSSRPTICFIGTLDNMHGLSNVLDSIHKSGDDFHLTIVGDGKCLAHYKRKFDHDKRFNFVGRLTHDQAMQKLANSDLALAVYDNQYPLFRKYGFYLNPLKLYEYLAYAKPCIYVGPNTSFIKYLAEEDAIVAVSSTRQLAAAIEKALAKKTYQTLQSNARNICKNFTWASSAHQACAIFKGLNRKNMDMGYED